MEGKERRQIIIKLLKESSVPLSGTAIASKMNVSRQVIVQDIALLRAVNKNILSTNKGYILFIDSAEKCKRTFYVKHNDESMEDELNTIVDNNGKVLDVVIEHEIYGQITVDLIINSRRDVKEFIEKINTGTAKPLSLLTNGVHYHTVEADAEDDLDAIEDELNKKGYLI